MFRKLLFMLALAAFLLPSVFAQINSIRSERAAKPAKSAAVNPLVVGEKLSYDVSWSDFIVAGELTLETKDRRSFDGVDGYHVSAQAQSVGVVSAFVYKVNDIYESFIDAATLQPFRAEKRVRRGKKRDQTSITLDQQRGTARLSDGKTLEIPAGTYDLASLFYAVRAMDMTPGKARTFTLLEDGKLYTVRIEPEGREKLRTRLGDYECIRISTKTLRDGEAKDPYNLRFYVTDDARRLPVLMTAEPSWGSVRIELTSATGTKKK